jgi:hypothetical protein
MDLQKNGVYTIANFLNEQEILEYTNIVLQPPENATEFTNTGIFDNNKFVNMDLANVFYTKLSQYIRPTPLALRPNNLIMTGNYKSGQQFNLHTDTGLYYNRMTKEKSRWTLLIYLNDNYTGGHTFFYDDDWKETHDIIPEKGTALLFDIDLWHRGDVIQSGTKYWIGCEIIGTF